MDPRIKTKKRFLRKKRNRAKIKSHADKLRLNIFRSLRAIYAQIIDDQKGKTLISASSFELTKEKTKKLKKTQIAYEVGKLLAQKAIKSNIEKAAFDRGAYKFHGRIKALAEGAKDGGLKF